MPEAELDQLLRRPAVIAAVNDLGLTSLALEDVLVALRSFGAVRIEVDRNLEHPYLCLLEGGEERARGRTVLHAALACWARALEDVTLYTERGVAELEQFLLGPDVA
jgi:hypothetical protein